MKRRNADCSKLRRPLKRNRITEGIYSSTFLYLKFLVVWVLVLLADFVLEFRFEYLWPFWLFIRSVYDSFRYQGLAFSVFFVCVAFTSDIICLLFIPVQWLFFAASTYVWVQYVWHTGQLTSALSVPYLDLSFPQCIGLILGVIIGYPVVTLGFGFKSYVSYKMRLRKQKEVQKENEFYMQLLQQALPPEQQMLQRQEREAEEAVMAKGVSSDVDPTPPVSQNGSTPGKKTPVNASVPLPELEYREKGRDGNSKEREGKQQQQHTIGINNNNSILHTLDSTLQETEYMENMGGKRLNNDLGGGENTHTPKEEVGGTGGGGGGGKNYKNATNSSPRNHSATNGTVPSSGSSNKNEKKTKSAGKGGANQKDPVENCIPTNQLGKPDALVRLEQDVKRLKADLQASRQLESDLRSHLSSLTSQDRSLRSELGQLRQDNEMLQNNADQAKQKDKQIVSQLEKRLKAEQEARALAEKQLADERKRKKVEEATAARAVALAAASRGECTDSLRGRIRELETECKKLSIDMKLKEEHIRELEGKCQELRKYKENEKDMEVVMSALSAMQDKTQHLENSLSAETRIKLDLFSALGDAKRQLEIAQGQIHQRDQEIAELKQKIAEVMAVMPSISYSNDSSSLSPVTPHYSSKFMDNSPSSLDPNASVYQPLKK
uniref:Macoilin 1a n=1 Tax=Salmo trutta TaxID=8032 RepID=A0A674DDU0_SALTR